MKVSGYMALKVTVIALGRADALPLSFSLTFISASPVLIGNNSQIMGYSVHQDTIQEGHAAGQPGVE